MPTYKLHLKCPDDLTEWDIELTADNEDKLISHSNFLRNPDDPKAAEFAAMKCPTCNKNDGHVAERVVS